MRPDDTTQNGRGGAPQVPQRSFVHTPPSRSPDYPRESAPAGNEAAAQVIRGQLDTIYSDDPTHTTTQPAAQPTQTPPEPVVAATQPTTDQTQQQQQNIDVNPYARTHTQQPAIQADQWKKYHSAWQDYYQKYYEGYYSHHLEKARRSASLSATPAAASPTVLGSHASEAINQVESERDHTGAVSKRQAVDELRQKLLAKVQTSAKKARKSRHFIPIAASAAVVLIFVFLQFNQVIIANVRAYVTPGNIDPQNIIVDPNANVQVSGEPRLIIPKINVDTPAFYGVGIDHASQMKAMEDGIAHFPIPGANSRPGQIGNTVLSGHSTNDVFAPGDFKFIFMQLDKLDEGDAVYANYEGTRYTYVVTKKEVVLPSEVSKLVYPTDKPVMTLITCTPLGTAEKRLLVTLEQVSPNPANARPAPSGSGGGSSGSNVTIPGQGEPTVFQRMFGN